MMTLTIPPPNKPGHDPLSKLRPFIDMLQCNFIYAYQPSKALSFNEAYCTFKGRLRFRVYNPMKPNRFHIKLFQISEASSGYILGFHIYTSKDCSCVSNYSKPLDSECTKTTKIVLGLLETTNLLDEGHHVYMDNYYSSPELFLELYYRETYACGTVRQNRKGLPNSVKKAKLKPLQSVFSHNGPMLCLKWSGEKTEIHQKTCNHPFHNSSSNRASDEKERCPRQSHSETSFHISIHSKHVGCRHF